MIEVTEKNFDEVVEKSEMPVLVDFWAPWCGPCQMLGPIIEDLVGEFDDVKICKVNVDEEGALAQEYEIMSIPCVHIFKNGEIVETLIGAQAKESYRAAIQKHI